MTDSIRAALPSQTLTLGMGHAPPAAETAGIGPGFGTVFLAMPMGGPGGVADPPMAALPEPPLIPVTPEMAVFQVPAAVLPNPVDAALAPSGDMAPAHGMSWPGTAGLGATGQQGADAHAPRLAAAVMPDMAEPALPDAGAGPESPPSLAAARQMAGVVSGAPVPAPAKPPAPTIAEVAVPPQKGAAQVPQPSGDVPEKGSMPPAPMSALPGTTMAGEGMESAGLTQPRPPIAASPPARPVPGRAVPETLTTPALPDMAAEVPVADPATDPAPPQPRAVPDLQVAAGRPLPQGGVLLGLPPGSEAAEVLVADPATDPAPPQPRAVPDLPVAAGRPLPQGDVLLGLTPGAEALVNPVDDPLSGACLPAAASAPAAAPGGHAAAPAGGAAMPTHLTAPPQAPQQAPPGMMLTVETPGDVRLVILPEGEAPHLLFVAERPETLDLLRRSADLLSAELRALGLADARFDFAGRDGPGGQGRGNPGAGNGAAPGVAAADPATAAPPLSVRPGALASGRLDLRL